jgi:hypothetical protein
MPSFEMKTQERTSGAEAHADFAGFAARLKSCPDTKRSRIHAELSFPQPVKPTLILQHLRHD